MRRHLPDSLVDLVLPLMDALGPLVPPGDAKRIAAVVSRLAPIDVRSVGLEVVLPPHALACDLSLLLPHGAIPDFLGPAHDALDAFVDGADTGTVWWEHDTSSDPPASGGFLRLEDGLAGRTDGFARARSAALGDPALCAALESLEAIVDGRTRAPGALLGFFPDRRPLPAAAALLPVAMEDLAGHAVYLGRRVDAGPDMRTSLIDHLSRTCDQAALAIGATASGSALSVEFSFVERERAMQQGRWRDVLTGWDGWGAAAPLIDRLLAIEGSVRFDAVPPVVMLSGIDHIKVGHDGKVKAYVGASIMIPGADA